jgi:hypothetical protein
MDGVDFSFTIWTRSSSRRVGLVQLAGIEAHNLTADLVVMTSPQFQGSGYAAAGAARVIHAAFEQIGLRKLYATTTSHSMPTGVDALCARLFESEGRLRQHRFVDGHWCDVVVWGLLATEWSRLASEDPALRHVLSLSRESALADRVAGHQPGVGELGVIERLDSLQRLELLISLEQLLGHEVDIEDFVTVRSDADLNALIARLATEQRG